MRGRIENNNVTISGIITREFKYSHETLGEKFYVSAVECQRTSGTIDLIPIMVSERIIDVGLVWIYEDVQISGTFRSYNKHTETGNHLILSVFVEEIVGSGNVKCDINEIHLDGYICKEVQHRETPLGREIADVLLAVNRPYGKSDYIPCIAWSRNARYASALNVGDRILIDGRIQSREYLKRLDNGEIETRTGYEVSVGSIKLVEERERKDETKED